MRRAWCIVACVWALGWAGAPSLLGAAGLACTRLDEGRWQVWLAEPDGTNARRVTDSPWDKRCLRVGDAPNTLLLRDNEGRLHRLGFAGSALDATLALDFEVIKDFDFDPHQGFLVASYAPNALDNVCIWHVPREGGAKRLLISDPYLNESPRWLRAGGRFLFAKSHAGKSHLCISELAQPKPKDFLSRPMASASDPCPSPDGGKVLFCAQGPGSVDLWICSGTGADARPLYAGPGIEAEPAWGPGGDWAYFTTWDGNNFRLARIRPDGNDFAFVSPGGVDCRCPVVIELGTL